MKKYTDLEYLQLSKWERFRYKFLSFFAAIPVAVWNLFKGIGGFFRKAGLGIAHEAKDIWTTFVEGDWKTKLSFLVMGFGSIARGQVLRGLLFLLFEVVFIGYMVLMGAGYLGLLPTLGTKGPYQITEKIEYMPGRFREVVKTVTYADDPTVDNSFKILLYGVLTIFFIVAFIYTWRLNVKQNRIAEGILKSGKKLKSGKDDLRSMVDDKFHATLLALPLTGILLFTVLPLVFMILVAFTNYSSAGWGSRTSRPCSPGTWAA